MKIGELGRATDTKVVTIRYYEQEGLLPKAERSSGNFRNYGTAELHRLRFIRRCRDLGFTLDQVRQLLQLAAQGDHSCSAVNEITAVHLEEIEQKITDLHRLADELRRLGEQCQTDGRIADCRIIEALSC